MTILTTQKEIQEASGPDLVETYNHLTGADLKKFSTVEAGRRRVEMAMLAAKDADQKTGVSAGSEGVVKGRDAIIAKAKSKGLPVPPSLDEEVAFAQGTLGAQLTAQAESAPAIIPREKADPKAPRTTRKLMFAVQATFAGTSTPQSGSVRNNVLLHIQAAENSAITVAALDAHFQQDTRGYINKLLEKDHLVLLDEKQFADAKPTKK